MPKSVLISLPPDRHALMPYQLTNAVRTSIAIAQVRNATCGPSSRILWANPLRPNGCCGRKLQGAQVWTCPSQIASSPPNRRCPFNLQQPHFDFRSQNLSGNSFLLTCDKEGRNVTGIYEFVHRRFLARKLEGSFRSAASNLSTSSRSDGSPEQLRFRNAERSAGSNCRMLVKRSRI